MQLSIFAEIIENLVFEYNLVSLTLHLLMEREGNDGDLGGERDKSLPGTSLDRKASIFNSTLLLDHVGEVILSLNSDGLSWKSVEPLENVCLSFFIAFNMFVKFSGLDCEIVYGYCLGICWFGLAIGTLCLSIQLYFDGLICFLIQALFG